jgi:hypothetical protein
MGGAFFHPYELFDGLAEMLFGIASGALLPYTNIWFEGTETGG